jgi:putative PIN family toxin of toxin-antitoxin system
MLQVVLDTNAVLSAVSRRSPYRIILDKLFDGEYDIFITTDILLEYEEKITEIFDRATATSIIDAMSLLDNVHKTDIYFNFQLIEGDPDDNKFVDCTFASNAHYLVTNDKHFNILKNMDFPKINLMRVEDFKALLASL